MNLKDVWLQGILICLFSYNMYAFINNDITVNTNVETNKKKK